MLTENRTVQNIGTHLQGRQEGAALQVFISPALLLSLGQRLEIQWSSGDRRGARRVFAEAASLPARGFKNSRADWVERFRPYIDDGTDHCPPARIRCSGPQANDLVLQLRKRGISRSSLGGMLANMCVESHLRDFLEQGFGDRGGERRCGRPRHPEVG